MTFMLSTICAASDKYFGIWTKSSSTKKLLTLTGLAIDILGTITLLALGILSQQGILHFMPSYISWALIGAGAAWGIFSLIGSFFVKEALRTIN